MIANRVIGGNGGETASIFITGLSETDTVTAVTPSNNIISAVWNGTAWVFEELKEYGTYTVTATDGTNTVTQDVLIDVATQYDIVMSSKLYLYNLGDECEDVTEGWVNPTLSTSTSVWAFDTNQSGGTCIREKLANQLHSKTISKSGYGTSGSFYTSRAIDFTSYSKLCFKLKASATTDIPEGYNFIFLSTINPDRQDMIKYDGSSTYSGKLSDYICEDFTEFNIDISGINGLQYILLSCAGYEGGRSITTEMYLEAMWLE